MNIPLTASADGPHGVYEQLDTSRLNGRRDGQSFLRIPPMALTYEIHQGSFNAVRFNAFIADKLLPLMQPFPASWTTHGFIATGITIEEINAFFQRFPTVMQRCIAVDGVMVK